MFVLSQEMVCLYESLFVGFLIMTCLCCMKQESRSKGHVELYLWQFLKNNNSSIIPEILV